MLDNARWVVRADREANLRILSRSDVDALRRALDEIGDLPLDELVDRTHAEPAYVAANGGRTRIEDLLYPSDPRRDEKAADLADAARHAVF